MLPITAMWPSKTQASANSSNGACVVFNSVRTITRTEATFWIIHEPPFPHLRPHLWPLLRVLPWPLLWQRRAPDICFVPGGKGSGAHCTIRIRSRRRKDVRALSSSSFFGAIEHERTIAAAVSRNSLRGQRSTSQYQTCQ